MSIFDEIKSDLENGTPGPLNKNGEHDWSLETGGENSFYVISSDSGPVAIVAVEAAFGMDDRNDADMRRFCRLPDLERIALAANELAEVAYLALSLIDQDNLEAKAGWDALDIAATTALTAFREATK